MLVKLLIYFIVSFAISAILGKGVIPVLKKLKVGQSERTDGPRTHLRKQGTPTMGGIIFLITMALVVTGACLIEKENIAPIVGISLATLGFGIIGFIDDYKKVVLKNTDGIKPMVKMFGLLIISIAFVMFLLKYAAIGSSIIIPVMNVEFNLPIWLYVAFVILVMLSTTNAINLTDGVDGLAGSISTIILIGMSIISLKLGYSNISVLSVIIAGSVFGFLIYNFYKAKVIMGDTGSLLLGGAISCIAIYLKLPLLLLVIAIIPVIETLSVILQIFGLYILKKKFFRMTPLHHHFELSGWRENKVVAVFSLVTLIAVVISILIV